MLFAHNRLARIKARPLLVQQAVQTALRDALAWRIGGGDTPKMQAFSAAAVAAARQSLDTRLTDVAELSRTLFAVRSAAYEFTRSPLWRRLVSVPASRLIRFIPTAGGPDAIVRDRCGRIHVVALCSAVDVLSAGLIAAKVAGSTTLPTADRLSPLLVHVFCLSTKRRHEFEVTVGGRTLPASREHTAA